MWNNKQIRPMCCKGSLFPLCMTAKLMLILCHLRLVMQMRSKFISRSWLATMQSLKFLLKLRISAVYSYNFKGLLHHLQAGN